jgi:hypothetical protein
MSRNATKAIEDGMIPLAALTPAEVDAMSDETWDAMEAHHVLVDDRHFEIPMIPAADVGRQAMTPATVRRHLTVEWDARMLQDKIAWRS